MYVIGYIFHVAYEIEWLTHFKIITTHSATPKISIYRANHICKYVSTK